MTDASSMEPHVSVRFTTRLEARFRVTEQPVQLPTRLTRYGLSEVINHLLNAEQPRPFDFVTDVGTLLRGSLAKYLSTKGLSGEDVLVLEYIELMAPPEEQSGAAHDDWVAAVASRSEDAAGDADNAVFLCGCYNGSGYVRDAAGQELCELRGHAEAVKDCAWLGGGEDDDAADGGVVRAVTASKDQTLRLWSVRRGGGGGTWAPACDAVCSGHADSVEAVAANPAGDAFCSGGWDGALKLWRVADVVSAAEGGGVARENGGGAPREKRARRSAAEAVPEGRLEAAAALSGHGDCVSGVVWPTLANAYSCSWDGTLKEWDVVAEAASTSLATGKV